MQSMSHKSKVTQGASHHGPRIDSLHREMSPWTVLSLLSFLGLAHGILLYGPCPKFEPETYDYTYYIERFEKIHGGEVLYFSNVRFERLFKAPPAEERYVSNYAIQLQYSNETGEDCFLPFELIPKTANMSRQSSRWENMTIINTDIIAVVNQEHMLAFSCVQDGNRKLEYIWILRNRRGNRIGLKRVQQLFGAWLDQTDTKVGGLIQYHYQLEFCPDRFWEIVVYSFTGVALFIALVAAIVYWKKNKRIVFMFDQDEIDAEAEREKEKYPPIEGITTVASAYP